MIAKNRSNILIILSLTFLVSFMVFSCQLMAATPASEKDVAEIVKKATASVVRVETQNHLLRVATGVVIDREGHIVTTALIMPRGGKLTVTAVDGRKMEADFISFDPETQIALIKTREKGLAPIALGKAESLAAGSWVCAIGITPENTPSVSQGIVSSLAGDRMRLNIWVTPGSSGGPVLNDKGQMVGLLRGIYTEERPMVFSFQDKEETGFGYVFSQAEAPSSGMALAIPVNAVVDVATQLREKKKVERGYLGVGIALNEKRQVVISEVEKGSPAEEIKLREGDIILKVGDRDITNIDSLSSEIRRRKPGEQVAIKIERNGKQMDVKAKLSQLPEEEARRELELRFPRLFRRDPGDAPGAVGGVVGGVVSPPARIKAPESTAFSLGKRRYIGVYCDELTYELAAHFGVKEGRALIVSRLTEGGPAAKANIRVGDIIVRVNGRRIQTVNELVELLQELKKSDKVKIEMLRDRKPVTVEVELAEESVGDYFNEENLRSYLESFRDYADRFNKEVMKWQDEYSDQMKINLQKIREEIEPKLKEIGPKIKETEKQIKERLSKIVTLRKV